MVWEYFLVCGVGGLDNIEYGFFMFMIFVFWLWCKYCKKVVFLVVIRSDLLEVEKGDGDVMVWWLGMFMFKKGEFGFCKGEWYFFRDFLGVVKLGEMMLVVGWLGSGCSIFFKIFVGYWDGYVGVEGIVKYGML